MNKKLEEKFKEGYEKTLENVDLQYDGNLKNIDYFGLFCKAGAQDKLYRFLGLDTCMFNYIHENQDSVLIIFSIPNRLILMIFGHILVLRRHRGSCRRPEI